MLVALFGPPGAGKDTVAKRLVEQHGFVRIAFADKVRELAYEMLEPIDREFIDEVGWERAKREYEYYRWILERVGDGARRVFGPDFWIDAVRGEVNNVLGMGKSVVITDLRKKNEMWYVHTMEPLGYDAKMWHVTRPGCEKRPFDEWRPEWAAFTIHNFGTVDELNQRVDEVLELCQ